MAMITVIRTAAVAVYRWYFKPSWDLATGVRPEESAGWRYFRRAVLIIAVLAGLVVVILGLQDQTLQTNAGEWRTTTLEDGSIVLQGPNTQLVVDFTNTARKVRLVNGEALFTVARNPNRSFQVVTNIGVVAALGTRFSIKQYDDDPVVVSVAEGVVGVTPRSRPEMKLRADQQLIVPSNGSIVQLAIDAEAEMQWTKTLVQFRDLTVGEIARELNHRNRLQIEIKDPAIAALRVRYIIVRLDDPRAFVDSMTLGSGIQSHTNPETGNIALSAASPAISVPRLLNPQGTKSR
jgi:transmembrane sensor